MDNATETLTPGLDELDDVETAFLIMEAVVFIPTLFGNTLIIVSVYKFPWLQTSLNALIVSLAFADLLVGLLLIPVDVVGTLFGLNSYKSVCLAQLSTTQTLLLSSLLNMLAISVERCFSVTLPHKHRMAKNKVYVTIFIIFSWVFAIGFSSIPALGWHTFSLETKCKLVTVWPQCYRYMSNVLIIGLVVAKVVFFSITVRVAVQRMHRHRHTEGANWKRRMAKVYLLIFISAIFIVCWAPFCIVSSTKLFLSYPSLATVHSWTLLLATCNAALNWLIYGLKNEKIRRAFKILLTCQKPTGARECSSN